MLQGAEDPHIELKIKDLEDPRAVTRDRSLNESCRQEIKLNTSNELRVSKVIERRASSRILPDKGDQ